MHRSSHKEDENSLLIFEEDLLRLFKEQTEKQKSIRNEAEFRRYVQLRSMATFLGKTKFLDQWINALEVTEHYKKLMLMPRLVPHTAFLELRCLVFGDLPQKNRLAGKSFEQREKEIAAEAETKKKEKERPKAKETKAKQPKENAKTENDTKLTHEKDYCWNWNTTWKSYGYHNWHWHNRWYAMVIKRSL